MPVDIGLSRRIAPLPHTQLSRLIRLCHGYAGQVAPILHTPSSTSPGGNPPGRNSCPTKQIPPFGYSQRHPIPLSAHCSLLTAHCLHLTGCSPFDCAQGRLLTAHCLLLTDTISTGHSGIDSRKKRPYQRVTIRESRTTMMPSSAAVRIRRPTPCRNFRIASGRE